MSEPSVARREATPVVATGERRELTAEEAAWIAVLGCAATVVTAMLLLGEPLGEAFLGPGDDRFLPGTYAVPEPTEHAHVVLACLGALALGAIVLLHARWPLRLAPQVTRALVACSQVVTFAFVVVAVLAQHNVGPFHARTEYVSQNRVFTWETLVVAGVLGGLLLLVVARAGEATRLARAVRETPARRAGCAVAATALTAIWVLPAVNTDWSIGNALGTHLVAWNMSETFAVLDGLTPLVDFRTQYAHLLPYPTAGVLALLGADVAVWTITMVGLSALALLSVYAILRRVVTSSLLALALYLPFLATGLFMMTGPPANRFSVASVFSLWPLRYAGPFLLAWLTARHVDGAAPRRLWLLFGAAGLVVLNNLEFGTGALLATVVAVACATAPISWRASARLAANAAAGIGGAVLVVSALTLARSGELPDFGVLLEFPRLYGRGGWVLVPMPTVGLHLAVYATFAAAIAVAAVRVARRDGGVVLTSMLAWSGVFGLVAGGYFAGRSDTLNLIALFAPWCLSLVLLVVVCVRRVLVTRRITLPALTVAVGFAVIACSVVQLPLPWEQLQRIDERAPTREYAQADVVRSVVSQTRPGEPVAILTQLGHRVAYDADVRNVAPYSSIESMPTEQQIDRTVEAMELAGASKLFIDVEVTLQSQLDHLLASGFRLSRRSGDTALLVRR